MNSSLHYQFAIMGLKCKLLNNLFFELFIKVISTQIVLLV